MNKKHFVVLSLILALVASGFWAAGAYAATDCFSDIASLPTVFQEAICWMKDSGVTSGYPDGTYKPNGYVTRAQMALFMKNQAEVPPSTGQIAIAGDTTSWNFTNSAAPINKDISNVGWTRFQRTEVGYNYLRISPTIPLSLYGKNLQFVGFEMCYLASTDATLSDIFVYNSVQTTTAIGTNKTLASDTTDRTDAACRYYSMSVPETMTADDAGIFIRPGVSWNTANAWFYIGRVTLYFNPTASPFVLPAGLSADNVVIMQPATVEQQAEDGAITP